jgi:hypothetical protein
MIGIISEIGVTPETLAALLIFLGVLLVASAIMGGGAQLAAINIPRLSGAARAAAALTGVVLLYFGLSAFNLGTPSAPTADLGTPSTPNAEMQKQSPSPSSETNNKPVAADQTPPPKPLTPWEQGRADQLLGKWPN